MSIDQETFHAFIEQTVKSKIPGFTLTSNAVACLHTHLEKYLGEIVSAAEECRVHAGRTTLRAEDVRLTLALKKRVVPFCLKTNAE